MTQLRFEGMQNFFRPEREGYLHIAQEILNSKLVDVKKGQIHFKAFVIANHLGDIICRLDVQPDANNPFHFMVVVKEIINEPDFYYENEDLETEFNNLLNSLNDDKNSQKYKLKYTGFKITNYEH